MLIIKRYSLSIALCLLLGGCNVEVNDESVNPHPTQQIVEHTEAPLLKESTDLDSIVDSPVIYDNIPVTNSDRIVPIELPLIDVDEEMLTVIKQRIGDAVIVIYSLGEEDQQLYAYVEYNNKTYDLGPIGYGTTNNVNYEYATVEALSQSWIKVSGALGANAPHILYIDFNKDRPTAIVISAHAREFDVDGDGIKEIVTFVGTAPYTTVYTMEEQQIVAIDLNELLNAIVVYYDDVKDYFNVQFEIDQPTTRWKLEKDFLKQVEE
ncbi:hypothetical protein [Paenibacillus endoradicis]|uniref:hypothetical protein n=1 Tax=Paenibacillus endoradicis TaxID=2972487 RepID=UPI00215901D6|nr:hypothetical protein [Paenibacillus endoradicis]MCR8657403.1 hypothetical protein [Paenibacillus endoradicis]